jgi:hypothetical protein
VVVVVGQLVLVEEQLLAQQVEVLVQEHFLQLVEAEVLPREVVQVLLVQVQVLLVQELLVQLGLQQFLL